MAIDVTPIEQEERMRLKFIVKNTNPSFMNALRRTVLMDVPTIAIDEIIMIENTTAMFDEYIAHRLGLIPLNSEIEEMNFADQCEGCDGSGCFMCTRTLSITQETDKNYEKTVYSKDLDPRDDRRVYPMVDDVPIMKMGKDQRLMLEAIARLNTGRTHAKFQPVGTITYQYMPKIEINSKVSFEEEIVTTCPKHNFKITDHKLELNDIYNGICQGCVKDLGEAVNVTYDPHEIIFELESTGALIPEEIILKATHLVEKKLENFIESLQEVMMEK